MSLVDSHLVEVKATSQAGLRVETVRVNPSDVNSVTGKATYGSFLASLKRPVSMVDLILFFSLKSSLSLL